MKAHPETNNYLFAKQAVNAYAARRALPLIQPSASTPSAPDPTDTPLARATVELWLGFGKEYREPAGRLRARDVDHRRDLGGRQADDRPLLGRS